MKVRTIPILVRREILSRRRSLVLSTVTLVGAAVAGALVLALLGPERGTALPAEADEVVALAGTVILWVSILSYGQVILQGVAEEKQTRVVEVVLGAVRPHQLMAAKVAAFGVVGLVQIGVTLGAFFGVGEIAGAVRMPPSAGDAVLAVFLWFVPGYLFYASLYAAAGALVARHQNASGAGAPLNLMLGVGYWIALVSLPTSGDNVVAVVASLLPPLSPLIMPLRSVLGMAPAWQFAVAMALLIASTLGLIRFAGRVYVGGILRGAGSKWREAFRARA